MLDAIVSERQLGDVDIEFQPGRKTVLPRRADDGVTVVLEETENGFLTHTSQDAEPILDLNKAKRDLGRAYYAADPELHRLASIPVGVAYMWLAKYGVEAWNPEHLPAVIRLLNDPEYQYLKTAEVIL